MLKISDTIEKSRPHIRHRNFCDKFNKHVLRNDAYDVKYFSFSNIVSVCLLLISLTAFFFAVSRTFRVKAVAKAEANASVDLPTKYVTKNIEDIRVGERTLGANPQGRVDDELDDSIFETVPFCKYSLRTAKKDGSQCDIQLLRPNNWLDEEITRLRRKIDGRVVDEVDLLADSLLLGELNSSDNYAFDVWLELPEMGVVGWATLTNVDENVDVQNGAGNVVTGTFAHIADNAIDLVVEDQAEPIGCTDNHPFWSVDRQDFIPAGELIEGERLLLYNGESKRVVQKLPRPGPQVVYNLEIYGEHVYHVAADGVLVHNACNYILTARIDEVNDVLIIGKRIPEDIAIKRLRNNFDVITSSKEYAKRLQKMARGGKPILDPPHGEDNYPHYHGQFRDSGHAFFPQK